MHTLNLAMNPVLVETIKGLAMPTLPSDRKIVLDEMAAWIRSKRSKDETAHLTFICTHNSRRSLLAQIWMKALAAYYGIGHLEAYSGGTEATAFYKEAVATLERSGFNISCPSIKNINPPYLVSYSLEAPPFTCFSKKYDDPTNPSRDFAAVMVCSDADENCPFVPGVAQRFSLPYQDPKEADGAHHVAETYDQRSLQIASEMNYILKQVLTYD